MRHVRRADRAERVPVSRPSWAAAVRVAVALAVLCGSVLAAGCSSGSGAPAAQGPASSETLAAAMTRLVSIDVDDPPAPSTGEGVAGAMDLKGPHPSHALSDPQQRAALEQQFAAARSAAAKYPTLATATAAGYVVTPFKEEGVGVHAVDWGLVKAFDPARPAMLLYDGTTPKARLLALSYYIVSAPSRQPAGFVGSDDHWHNHIDICIRAGELLPTTHRPDACAALHGTYLSGRNLWMLHLWIVKGEPNPWGLFATYNPRLDDGTGESH
jgi:hypothetical protein